MNMKDLLMTLLASAGLAASVSAQTLDYAKALEGDDNQSVASMSVGKDKKLYIGGFIEKTCDFDPGSGVLNASSGFGTDAFFARYDTAGNALWVKTLEGSGAVYEDVNNGSISLVADNNGNVVITGICDVTIDMDPDTGVYSMVFGGYADSYLAKYNPIGELIWAFPFAGGYWDVTTDLELDKFDRILVCGHFYDSLDFDPGPGVVMRTATGLNDIFFAKYSASGSLLWVSTWGSPYSDVSGAFCQRPNGNIYFTGVSNDSIDLDPGAGVNRVPAGTFLVELDPSGNYLRGISFGGGWGGGGIATGEDGNIVLTGGFNGTVDFDPGPGTLLRTNTGLFADMYIACYDSTFAPLWVNAMGSNGMETASAPHYTPEGDVVVMGDFPYTIDFDPGPDTVALTTGGYTDGFMARYDGLTGALVWLVHFEGTSFEYMNAMTMDDAGRIYIGGGNTSTVDYDPQASVVNLTTFDKCDGWFARYTDVLLTSAEQPLASQALQLWPNPAAEVLHLRSGSPMEGYRVVDASGKKILSEDIDFMHEGQIDVSALPAGLFLIQVQMKEGTLTHRFIRQ
jgi:hypothetical protein